MNVLLPLRAHAQRLGRSALMLAAFAPSGPADAVPPAAGRESAPPSIQVHDGAVRSTEISILTYNVAGLPWPIRVGREAALARIGAELGRLRRAGQAPDVVLLQEAFSGQARRIGRQAGYPYHLRGPARDTAPLVAPGDLDEAFLDGRRWYKGEGVGKLVDSGLYVLSDFPITAHAVSAFGRNTCAGYDCLANKGAMVVSIDIPGVPEPLQVMNTHMNARRAAGVPRPRALYAHRRQIDELATLLEHALPPGLPFVFGGDFNMRRSPARYGYALQRIPGTVVRYYCTQVVSDCDIRMSFDGDEPWMDTQDLQGFANGQSVRLRPKRIAAMFDEPYLGRALSDHDGYLVTYELSWSPQP